MWQTEKCIQYRIAVWKSPRSLHPDPSPSTGQESLDQCTHDSCPVYGPRGSHAQGHHPRKTSESPADPLGETPAEASKNPSERQISPESLAEGCAPRMVTLRNFSSWGFGNVVKPQFLPVPALDKNRSPIFTRIFFSTLRPEAYGSSFLEDRNLLK